MPKRRRLTDEQIARLPRGDKRHTLPDPELIGHYLRIPPRTSRAPIAFTAVARDPNGKQIWMTIGAAPLGIDRARELAREAIGHIKVGKPTSEPDKPTVRAVAEQWLDRQVRKNGFRTAREIERIIDKYIVPAIGDRAFADVRRIDVANLLDRIEDDHGTPMAESVLTVYRAVSRWWQQRDETYNPPLTAGMSRLPKAEARRKRILGDDEIRAIWHTQGRFGDFARLLLLTAQRRDKLLTLRWDDLDADGVWTIRTEPREKGNPGKLKLPSIARDLIRDQPRFVDNTHVFAGRNGLPRATLAAGQYKAEFDRLCGVTGWRLHDLRRTARSLMSRAGVQTEIAEMVLGHARDELLQTYDRHSYDAEKTDALEKLAALITQIVLPWRRGAPSSP
jgi:integrase